MSCHVSIPPRTGAGCNLFLHGQSAEPQKRSACAPYRSAARYGTHSPLARHPFHIDAWIVLPDHMHYVWTLPDGDADFALRWKVIKFGFAKRLPKTEVLTVTQHARGERGIWQRRYWGHLIQDERDYRHHVDYVHLNPQKHGLVDRVADWPYSSFHRAVRAGVYTEDWCGDDGTGQDA